MAATKLGINIIEELIHNKYGENHNFTVLVKDPISTVTIEWLDENLEGKYGKIPFYYLFELKSDATLFKLTWDFT